MTIRQALQQSLKLLKKSRIPNPELDCEILLSFVLKKSKEYLYINFDKKITATVADKFLKLIKRRAKHEPVAYITGHKEFFGLDFKINKNVLIPHPETELLVEETIKYASKIAPKGSNLTLVDVGTGSGAIAISLKKSLPQAKIMATDISAKALKIARLNARANKTKINFLKGNLLSPVQNKAFDILITNLPYLDKKDIKNLPWTIKKSIQFDPTLALDGGKNGLDLYNKLFQQINKLKQQPKLIACEINEIHYKKTLGLAKEYFPKSKIKIKKDLAGFNRILIIQI